MVTFGLMPGSQLHNYRWFQRDSLGFLVFSRSVGDMVAVYKNDRRPSYVVHHPDVIKEILVTKEKQFHKGRTTGILQRTVGTGVLTSEGPTHERQKKAMMPAFAKPSIEAYAESVVTHAEALVQTFRAGEERDLSHDMMLLTLRIICQTMLGVDLQREAEQVGLAVEACIHYSAKRIYSPLPIPLALPTGTNRRFKAARGQLDAFARTTQAQHRTQHQAQHRPEQKAPLLDVLLEQSCPEQEIRDQIVTILIAGHETTANLLGWVFYLLAKHPAVSAQLTQELRQVVAPGERLTYHHLAHLPFATAVIQETLRLYPPAWAILRENLEPVELGGKRITGAGSYIISPYAIHRDPAVFPDPERFDPARFLRKEQELPRFAYLPFGAGSRACIGSQYAMMEATLILATLWRHGTLHLPDPTYTATPEPSVSLRIKGGLQTRWRPEKS